MSKDSRGGKRGGDVPGPGHYDSQPKSSGPAYSMSNRGLGGPQGDQPGPGSYEPSYSTSKNAPPSYKFGEKPAYNASTSSPGPGAYDI